MAAVSIYPHIKEVSQGITIELAEVFELIQSGHWKEKVESLQAVVNSGANDKEISKHKAKLPYFTGSGTFSVRKDDGLIEHSGRIIIDFDKVPDLDQARADLVSDKFTECLFQSCSGRGFAVVVKIIPDQHKDIHNYLKEYYQKQYGISLDVSCKDLSRPRYISFDPNLFYNPNSETAALPSATVDSDEDKFNWAYAVHNKRNEYIEGNRHHYLITLAFFLNKCGVSHSFTLSKMLEYFLSPDKGDKEIISLVNYAYNSIDDHGTYSINKNVKDMPSEYSDKFKHVYRLAHSQNHMGNDYTSKDIDAICADTKLSKEVVESIFKNVYENNKDEFGLSDKAEIVAVEIFIKKRWEIRLNEVTHRLEFKERGSPRSLQKLNTDQIYRELQHAKFNFTLDRLKSLLRSDFVEKHNPFKAYFHSLPQWDGRDYISELAGYIQTDNQEFWKSNFRKALIRQIKGSIDHVVNRIILTLVQPDEESGKTSFIRFLCPPALSDYYTETALDHSKDSDIALSENFLWNLEELAALNTVEINRLKATISKATVKQRAAYKEFAETNPRRCTFWASTNKSEFFTEDQNTRWICFNVKSINHNYNNTKTGVKEIDINLVWAQAWALYNAGEDCTLTESERKERNEINKNYEVFSIEKDLILRYFTPSTPFEDACEFLTTTEILLELTTKTDSKIKINAIQLGRMLKRIGFDTSVKKIRGNAIRGYYIERVSTQLGLGPYDSEKKF